MASNALAWPIEQYITSQRDHLAISAAPLSEHSRLRLRHYFSPADLDRVLVLEADPLPIPNPPLYPLLKRLGLDLPEPRLAAAITLDNVVAAREAMTLRLLFHELVHTVQFRILGVRAFSQHYVKGFLKGRSYEKIPLEACAFQLAERFASERKTFNVAEIVSEWICRGLF